MWIWSQVFFLKVVGQGMGVAIMAFFFPLLVFIWTSLLKHFRLSVLLETIIIKQIKRTYPLAVTHTFLLRKKTYWSKEAAIKLGLSFSLWLKSGELCCAPKLRTHSSQFSDRNTTCIKQNRIPARDYQPSISYDINYGIKKKEKKNRTSTPKKVRLFQDIEENRKIVWEGR